MNQKFNVKNKIISHLIKNGEKKTGEKILLQSAKELQKTSIKKSIQIIKLAIYFSIPIFKIHRRINKKNKRTFETPVIIQTLKAKISLAIKYILLSTKKKQSNQFYFKLYNKLSSNAQNKESIIEDKNQFQKQALLKKHVFFYYRWK